MDRHPEVYPFDRFGRRKGFGHRNYYSVNAPALWVYVDRLVEAMAEHYRQCDSIMGWQIDNELGGSGSTLSYGEVDRRAFIDWLRARYTTIDELNDAWGTVFSNQVYGSFEEIIVPSYGAIDLHNPGLELDFRRFSSDASIAFIQRQRSIIKQIIPEAVVTTNFVSSFFEIDYFKLARSLDITAIGSYPNCNPVEEHRPGDMAFYHDAAYGYRGAPYWMLEQQSGTPGSTTLKLSPEPGDIGRWSAQSLARGSDVILYFRWRSCVFGLEQYWHGILPHSGKPNRRLEEASAFAHDVQALVKEAGGGAANTGDPHSSRPQAKAVIVLSFDNWWVFDVQPHFDGHRYAPHLQAFHRALTARGIHVDIIAPYDSFEGYSLVIAPNLAIADLPGSDESISERITEHVKAGGHFVCDFRSGTRTRENQMLQVPAPGPLAELLGIEVVDYGIIEPGKEMPLTGIDGGIDGGRATGWFEELELTGAEAVAAYGGETYLAGKPAITRNASGTGAAWYVASVLEEPALEAFLAGVCDEAGVEPVIAAPRGVEAVVRRVGSSDYLFLINHSGEAQRVAVPEGAGSIRCSAGTTADGGELTLAARAYAFVELGKR
jgi:beta-galactosidase